MLYIPIPEYSSTVDSKKFHTQIFHNTTHKFFIEGAGKKSSFLNKFMYGLNPQSSWSRYVQLHSNSNSYQRKGMSCSIKEVLVQCDLHFSTLFIDLVVFFSKISSKKDKNVYKIEKSSGERMTYFREQEEIYNSFGVSFRTTTRCFFCKRKLNLQLF